MAEDERTNEELHEEIEQLKKSAERYQWLAEATFEGIVIHDKGRVIDVNKRIEEISGYPREALIGKEMLQILDPDSQVKVDEHIQENDESPYEIGAKAQDGSHLDLEVLGKEMQYGGSTVRVAAVRDISERKAAEEALRKSEERYRLVAENVDDIIFTLGNDLTFNYVSPSFVKITGFSFEELYDIGWQGLFTPESLERIMDSIAEDAFGIMEEGREAIQPSVMIDAELKKKDGTSFWIEVNVSTIHDEDGIIIEMLGVARDVSERKATQERFIEEKKRAELYLDLFGHDIRNINQGIMSYLELVLMRPGIGLDEADYINAVLQQATRINDLVAKVQRLTQLRARKIIIEDVDAQPLIHAAVDYVMAKYSDRDVKIDTRSSCSIHTVKGSKMLTDVFTSILDNAIRFNRSETVTVDISCKLTEDSNSIRFMFDDRGPGIADGNKGTVFRRLEDPESEIKGSGLGLTVAWEIIRQLNGRIWVEDRVYGDPSQGSRFVVELPVAVD